MRHSEAGLAVPVLILLALECQHHSPRMYFREQVCCLMIEYRVDPGLASACMCTINICLEQVRQQTQVNPPERP